MPRKATGQAQNAPASPKRASSTTASGISTPDRSHAQERWQPRRAARTHGAYQHVAPPEQYNAPGHRPHDDRRMVQHGSWFQENTQRERGEQVRGDHAQHGDHGVQAKSRTHNRRQPCALSGADGVRAEDRRGNAQAHRRELHPAQQLRRRAIGARCRRPVSIHQAEQHDLSKRHGQHLQCGRQTDAHHLCRDRPTRLAFPPLGAGSERMVGATPAPDPHGQRSQLRQDDGDPHGGCPPRCAGHKQGCAHRTHQCRGQQGPHWRVRIASAATQCQTRPRDEHERHHQQPGTRIADRSRQDVCGCAKQELHSSSLTSVGYSFLGIAPRYRSTTSDQGESSEHALGAV